MNRGYVKLWRKVFDTGLLQNPEAFTFFGWCLLKATHKPITQLVGAQSVDLLPGQFIFGRKAAAAELKTTERKIRTCLALLNKINVITQKATNKYTIISLVNWETYQASDQASDQQATSKRPASDQETTTNKKLRTKEAKKEPKEPSPPNGEAYYLTSRKKRLKGKRLETFLTFWDAFAYKQSKAEAAQAWLDIPELTDALCTEIYAAAAREASNRTEDKTPKMAQGWITARRWEDEPQQFNGPSGQPRNNL